MEISAVIITYNEADRLADALESLKGICEEIIVIDSNSTDETAQIAASFGAEVIVHPFVDYSAQKNYAITHASFCWILSIDADERLSQNLAKEILIIKEKGPGSLSAFSMPRKTWYLGRFILHSGWYPDRKIRLFDKHRAKWCGLIHERLLVEGPLGRLNEDIHHFTYRDISDHITRMNRYSSLLAEGLKNSSPKFLLIRALGSPFFSFFRHYFLKKGFLDGFAGLVIALLSSYGTALKYLKAFEYSQKYSTKNSQQSHLD